MSQFQSRISDQDGDQYVLDRLELGRKLERADLYIQRIQQRLKILDKKRQQLLKSDGVIDVSDRFNALKSDTVLIDKEF